ncbi:FxDxF family PEP-CTERM protein [Scleromatobacter humisilvae]|uniref:FxDxF family PEP-CTERM protein n=1 Tax=Scleromatobacter humisilvae TaxID=2897159 RepID=A0A9X2BYT7_9BURK|nr:FxDxF family PEP-CTERM protein [Scleromatobacter humisilvae]MCK9684571.1 FxDxF family PEP-CTERM protein [Scleromatobacter humisilvae]
MTSFKKLALATAFAAFAVTGAQAAEEDTLFLLSPTTEGTAGISTETYLIDSLGKDIGGLVSTRTSGDTFYDDYLLEINDAQSVSFYVSSNTVKVGRAFVPGIKSFSGFVLTDLTGATHFNPLDSEVDAGFLSGDWMLGSGTYDLEITGTLGANGGGYSGELDTAPVPEPTGWALMMAGLGAMGMLARRRQNQG